MPSAHIKLLFFVALILSTAPALAQNVQGASVEQEIAKRIKNSKDKNFVSISIENDSIGGGTDRFYTSGVRATWFNVNTPVPEMMDKLADQIPTFDLNETTGAFLYGSVGLATLKDNHIDELELTLGVVGPEALGEQSQKLVHRHLSNSPIPRGWRNQLDFEPALIVSAQRRWPKAFLMNVDSFQLRAEPNVNFSLGNVYTYAGAGVTFALAPFKTRFQDTPPRVRPATPGSGFFEAPEEGLSWLLFASADARLVGRNIFLDGNSFSDSHSVDKKPLVGDVSAGIALTYDHYRLSYAFTARSKEFDGQDRNSTFGSLTLSTRF